MRAQHLAFFLLALASVLAWYYFPFLSQQFCFYRMDSNYFFEPFCRYIGTAFAHGRLPLWNSLSFCGMPQIAITSPALFYPFHLLFAWLDFSQAAAAILICHQLLAGLGGFLLVASLGWGVVPATVCGTTLALCGYMFSLESNYTLAATASWLPINLWALSRIEPKRKAPGCNAIAIASVSVCLLVSAGRPEIWLPGLAVLAVYIILSAVHAEALPIRQAFLRASAVLIGIMLAMPSILPALEWTRLSPRSAGLPLNEVLKWSANWYDCICLVLSPPLGDLIVYPARFAPLVVAPNDYFPLVASHFVGPIAFTLCIWALSDRSFKARLPLSFGFLAFLCLALGANTPLGPFLYKHCHTMSLFRYPVKLMIFPAGIMSVMAARGAYLGSKGGPGKPGEQLAGAFWAGALLFSLFLIGSATSFPGLFGWAGMDRQTALEAIRLIGRAGLVSSLLGLSLCLLARLTWSKTIGRHILPAFIILVSGSLLVSSAYANIRRGGASNFYRRTSNLKRQLEQTISLRHEGLLERFLPLIFDPITRPAHYQGCEGLDRTGWFFQYARQVLLPNCHMDSDVPSSLGYESAETGDYKKMYMAVIAKLSESAAGMSGSADPSTPLVRFCRLTATKYVETPAVVATPSAVSFLRPLPPQYFEPFSQHLGMNARIYRIRQALPRAYFATSWQPMASRAAFMNLLLKGQDAGFDPAENPCVEIPDKTSQLNYLPLKLERADGASIEWIKSQEENISLQARTPARRLLVLSDTFYPGWQARIDGRPAEIYQANIIQRLVVVPAGQHLIEFTYRPFSLYLGFMLSFAAALALASAYVWTRLTARR